MKENRQRVTSRTVGQSLEGQEESHEEGRRRSQKGQKGGQEEDRSRVTRRMRREGGESQV